MIFIVITMDINELVSFCDVKPDSDNVKISLPVDELLFNQVVVLDVIDAFANFNLVRRWIFLQLESVGESVSLKRQNVSFKVSQLLFVKV